MKSVRAAALFFVLLGLAVSPAAAQSIPLSTSTAVPSGVLDDVAYDAITNTYLHIWEYNRDIWGKFFDANGQPIGGQFIVAPYKLSFAGRPKVGGGGGRFLLTYLSDVNLFDAGFNIFGQIIRPPFGGDPGGLEGSPR